MCDIAMDSQLIKILLVDDSRENLYFLSDILQRQGYQVQSFISGQSAINTALASPPDLILLNIIMSEMNGYEVYQHLKANQKTQDIPIIFLNNLDEISEKVNVFELDGVDFITKPLQTQEVLFRIQNQFNNQRLKKQLLKEQNIQEALQKQIERSNLIKNIIYKFQSQLDTQKILETVCHTNR